MIDLMRFAPSLQPNSHHEPLSSAFSSDSLISHWTVRSLVPRDRQLHPRTAQAVEGLGALGLPSINLVPGLHTVSGNFFWKQQPEIIAVPSAIGLLALTLDGQNVNLPNRDTSGWLCLRCSQASAEEKVQFSLQVYRVLEDGLPMWLRTELEVSVSGKSREEDLGFVLPANWQLFPCFSGTPGPGAIAPERKKKKKRLSRRHSGTEGRAVNGRDC